MVGASVIDRDELQVPVDGSVQDAPNDRPQCSCLVVDGHQYRQLHVVPFVTDPQRMFGVPATDLKGDAEESPSGGISSYALMPWQADSRHQGSRDRRRRVRSATEGADSP